MFRKRLPTTPYFGKPRQFHAFSLFATEPRHSVGKSPSLGRRVSEGLNLVSEGVRVLALNVNTSIVRVRRYVADPSTSVWFRLFCTAPLGSGILAKLAERVRWCYSFADANCAQIVREMMALNCFACATGIYLKWRSRNSVSVLKCF